MHRASFASQGHGKNFPLRKYLNVVVPRLQCRQEATHTFQVQNRIPVLREPKCEHWEIYISRESGCGADNEPLTDRQMYWVPAKSTWCEAREKESDRE